MNIAFFHFNGIMPTAGGISRITVNLTSLFRINGIKVFYIGARKTKEYDYDSAQIFLPNTDLMSSENIEFISNFIKDHSITTVINQGALSPLSHIFLAKVKQKTGIKIISCIHNPILTPIKNYPYQKEYLLRKKHLVGVFHLLKTPVMRYILGTLYCRKHRSLYKLMYNESDFIIGLSNGMKDDFAKITKIENLSKFVVIPNFIDTTVSQSECKEKTVLWVGTINIPVKRTDFMLKAWKRLCKQYPEWTLKILGNGPDYNEAVKLSEKYKLSNCTFVGRVNPDEYYNTASILCVTSSYEGFSLVLLEALKYGVTPLAVNSFSTANEILGDGEFGVLSSPFDMDDFCEKLQSLMDDDEIRRNYSNKSKKAIERYSSRSVFSKWEKILS